MKSSSEQGGNADYAPITIAGDAADSASGDDRGAQLLRIEKNLDASHQTSGEITDELTARETQISAILTSRAWRWVCRYSRVKRGYLVPAYEFLRRLSGNGQAEKRKKSRQLTSALLAPRQKNLDPADESLVLLPTPGLRRLASTSLHSAATFPARSDVICFSIVDWHFRYQRPQQIISQFAAHGHRVFYIRLDATLPAHVEPRFSITKLKENVYRITLAAHRQTWINQEDIRGANADQLLDSLDELRETFHINEAIGYVMTPSWTTMALAAKARWGWRIIYHSIDESTGFPSMARPIPPAEQRLVRECELSPVTP